MNRVSASGLDDGAFWLLESIWAKAGGSWRPKCAKSLAGGQGQSCSRSGVPRVADLSFANSSETAILRRMFCTICLTVSGLVCNDSAMISLGLPKQDVEAIPPLATLALRSGKPPTRRSMLLQTSAIAVLLLIGRSPRFLRQSSASRARPCGPVSRSASELSPRPVSISA